MCRCRRETSQDDRERDDGNDPFHGVLPVKRYTFTRAMSTLPASLLAWLATALVTSACGTAFYDKPGLTYTEWRHDDAECRLAARGGNEHAAVDQDLYRGCLRERGYHVPAKRVPGAPRSAHVRLQARRPARPRSSGG